MPRRIPWYAVVLVVAVGVLGTYFVYRISAGPTRASGVAPVPAASVSQKRTLAAIDKAVARLVGQPPVAPTPFARVLAVRQAIRDGDFHKGDRVLRTVLHQSRVGPWAFAPFTRFLSAVTRPAGARFARGLNAWVQADQKSAMAHLVRASYYDAGMYMIAQILGGIAGGFGLLTVLHGPVGHLGATTINTDLISVRAGFLLEALGTFFLTTTALHTAMSDRAGNAAPLAIGFTLVMIVTFMGPLTGASVNPARSLGPAVAGGYYPHIWVYLTATPLGGLVAGLLYKFMQDRKTDMHFMEAMKDEAASP